jgi:hypothetical protein
MSSSLVHTTFTGFPTAFEIVTASTTKSGLARLPKPHPKNVVFA